MTDGEENYLYYLHDMAWARKQRAENLEKLRVLEDAMKDSADWQTANALLERANAAEEKARNLLEEFAKRLYEINKNKHPFANIEIEIKKIVKVKDPATALLWCRTNYTPALEYIKSVFEKAVKDGLVPEEIAITVSVDLSKYLELNE